MNAGYVASKTSASSGAIEYGQDGVDNWKLLSSHTRIPDNAPY